MSGWSLECQVSHQQEHQRPMSLNTLMFSISSNVPRLPVAPGTDMGHLAGNGADMHMAEMVNGSNEFNITNFMVDANSDWLFKNQS